MSSRALVDHWWERLRVSWWFVPSAFVAFAIALSFGSQVLDERLGSQLTPAWAQFRGSIDGARSILSVIAASMMTFSGLVFSVTVLVLQLASTQFSPRVLRTFLADRRSQAFLGLFVGTFVYALLGLANIKSIDNDRITSIPVWLGILLALGSVVGLIAYVNHVVQSIRVSVIIRRLGDEARATIEQLYPDSIGAETSESDAAVPAASPSLVLPYRGVSGVVERVDERALFEQAEQADVAITMTCEVGDFVGYSSPLFLIAGDAAQLNEQAVYASVRIGRERSVTQDTAFAFRELIDIAERALSPSLNDPTTAVQVIDQLQDLLMRLARRRFPSPVRRSQEGHVRLVLPRPDWAAYLRLALDEIRHYGRGSLQVTRRLRALVDDLEHVVPAFRRHELARQRRLLDESVRRGFDSAVVRRVAGDPSKQGHGSLTGGSVDVSAEASDATT